MNRIRDEEFRKAPDFLFKMGGSTVSTFNCALVFLGRGVVTLEVALTVEAFPAGFDSSYHVCFGLRCVSDA